MVERSPEPRYGAATHRTAKKVSSYHSRADLKNLSVFASWREILLPASWREIPLPESV